MSEITRAVIRLGLRQDRIGQKTVEQSLGSDPSIWAGNDVEIQFAALWESEVRSLAQMDYIQLDILPAAIPAEGADNPIVTATLAGAELDNAITYAQWDAKTHQQGSFVLTRAQMELLTVDAGEAAKTYWLVIWGLTTHTPAREITLGIANLVVIRDRSGGTPPEPGEGKVWLDVDAADARYAPISLANQISIPAGRRLVYRDDGTNYLEEIE